MKDTVETLEQLAFFLNIYFLSQEAFHWGCILMLSRSGIVEQSSAPSVSVCSVRLSKWLSCSYRNMALQKIKKIRKCVHPPSKKAAQKYNSYIPKSIISFKFKKMWWFLSPISWAQFPETSGYLCKWQDSYVLKVWGDIGKGIEKVQSPQSLCCWLSFHSDSQHFTLTSCGPSLRKSVILLLAALSYVLHRFY